MVSGGRPSFFLRCLSAGFGALVGFVRPIAAAFTFHGSATPYRINAPSGKLKLIIMGFTMKVTHSLETPSTNR
jgi:hypothetical protein